MGNSKKKKKSKPSEAMVTEHRSGASTPRSESSMDLEEEMTDDFVTRESMKDAVASAARDAISEILAQHPALLALHGTHSVGRKRAHDGDDAAQKVPKTQEDTTPHASAPTSISTANNASPYGMVFASSSNLATPSIPPKVAEDSLASNSGGVTRNSSAMCGPFAPPPSTFVPDLHYKHRPEHWRDFKRINPFEMDVKIVETLLQVRDKARLLRIPPEDLITVLNDIVPTSTVNWSSNGSSDGYRMLEAVGNNALKQTHIVILLSDTMLFHQPNKMPVRDYFSTIFKFMTVEQAQQAQLRKEFFLRVAAGVSTLQSDTKDALLKKIEELGDESKHLAKVPTLHFDIIWEEVCREHNLSPSTATNHTQSSVKHHQLQLPHTHKKGPHHKGHDTQQPHRQTPGSSSPSNTPTPMRLPATECPSCRENNVFGQWHWKSECPFNRAKQLATPPSATPTAPHPSTFKHKPQYNNNHNNNQPKSQGNAHRAE